MSDKDQFIIYNINKYTDTYANTSNVLSVLQKKYTEKLEFISSNVVSILE